MFSSKKETLGDQLSNGCFNVNSINITQLKINDNQQERLDAFITEKVKFIDL